MTPELRSVLEDFEDKQFPPDVSKSCYYYRCQLVNSESRRFISKSSAMRRAKVWLVQPHRFCPTIFLPRFHSLNNRFNPKGEEQPMWKMRINNSCPAGILRCDKWPDLFWIIPKTTNCRYTSNPLSNHHIHGRFMAPMFSSRPVQQVSYIWQARGGAIPEVLAGARWKARCLMSAQCSWDVPLWGF